MKIAILSLVVGILCIMLLYYFRILPTVYSPKRKDSEYFTISPGQNFNPIQNIKLIEGHSTAYLVISKEDINHLPKGIRKCKVLKCSDIHSLSDLKSNFVFSESGGDEATCESELIIYVNDVRKFRISTTITESGIGLQSNYTGFAYSQQSDRLKYIFAKFEPVLAPFVILK